MPIDINNYRYYRYTFIQIKGRALFQGEMIIKWKECIEEILESFSPEPMETWHIAWVIGI